MAWQAPELELEPVWEQWPKAIRERVPVGPVLAVEQELLLALAY